MRLLPLIALAALACSPAQSTDTAADEQAIRGKVDGWNQDITSRNDSAIAALYAPDAVVMVPNSPKLTDRQAVRGFYASLWPLRATLSRATTAIYISGDQAIETGTWSWTQPVPRGQLRDHGNYVVGWRRVDGDWLVAQDIWNSDSPAQAPTPK